jgi:hypothetical protein
MSETENSSHTEILRRPESSEWYIFQSLNSAKKEIHYKNSRAGEPWLKWYNVV